MFLGCLAIYVRCIIDKYQWFAAIGSSKNPVCPTITSNFTLRIVYNILVHSTSSSTVLNFKRNNQSSSPNRMQAFL